MNLEKYQLLIIKKYRAISYKVWNKSHNIDLFLKVPARLKFMKTNATEIRCKDCVNDLAMSHPKIYDL